MSRPHKLRLKQRQRQRGKPWRTLRALIFSALASFLLTPALAPADAMANPLPAGVATADGVLAKVKAEHPDGVVLKIELLRPENAELPEWIYEVKLFPPDGRILRLTYDAKTLAHIETVGGGHHCRHGGEHKRLRMRQGWGSGWRRNNGAEQ